MAVIRLDKVMASITGAIVSVKHSAQMVNGLVFHADAIVGERELKQVRAVSVASLPNEPVYFLAAPEIMYDPRLSGLKDFVIDPSTAARAYAPAVTDVYTVTLDGFTATPVVGQFVVPATNGTMKLAPSVDGAGSRLAFKVTEKTILGADATEAYVIECTKS